VGKHHHEGYGNRESPVKRLFFIEDIEDKNSESHAGQYGTQGDKPGQV
jgi:hypothetical protein